MFLCLISFIEHHRVYRLYFFDKSPHVQQSLSAFYKTIVKLLMQLHAMLSCHLATIGCSLCFNSYPSENELQSFLCFFQSPFPQLFLYNEKQCHYNNNFVDGVYKKHPLLTHYHTMLHFDALKIYSCRKHCEKRRNCV